MKVISGLKKILSALSARELNLWAELLLNIIIALHYFPNALRLIKNDEWSLYSSALLGLVISTIALAIVGRIFAWVCSHMASHRARYRHYPPLLHHRATSYKDLL